MSKMTDFIEKAKKNNLWSLDELYKMIESGEIVLDYAIVWARLLLLAEIPHDPNDTLYKAEPELAHLIDEETTSKTSHTTTENLNDKKKIDDEFKKHLYYLVMWATIRESLSKKISESEYLLWIESIVFDGIDGEYALLKFNSELRRDVVLQQYGDLIKQEFKNLYNLDVEIKASVV